MAIGTRCVRTDSHVYTLGYTLICRILPKGYASARIRWILMVLLLTALSSGQSVVAKECNPLLVLVSGAGFSESEGTGMKELGEHLDPILADLGIAIISVQNHLFTERMSFIEFFSNLLSGLEKFRTIKSELVRDLADLIKDAEYSPVVVIGHSWGAASALSLADYMESDLVVTLDTVAKTEDGEPLSYPLRAKRWINVYTLDDGFLEFWRWGGAQDYIEVEGVENIKIKTKHEDVVGMFNGVHEEVYESLKCPGGSYYVDGVDYYKQQKICETYDGVHCTISWNIRDHCSDERGLEVKFYSIARGPKGENKILGYYGPYKVDSGGELVETLGCRAGTKVCYEATSQPPELDQKEWGYFEGSGYKKHCFSCLSTKKTDTPIIDLVCPNATNRSFSADDIGDFEREAQRGSALAQFNLGLMYHEGNGVRKDPELAVRWYRKAAEQGYARAQHNLGIMYSRGNGVRKDPESAVHWFRKAAEQGHAPAQHNLGIVYEIGKGVPVIYDEAVRWYIKAAEQGYARAQHNLGIMYSRGNGVRKDYAKAVCWHWKAAEQGYELAQDRLDELYEYCRKSASSATVCREIEQGGQFGNCRITYRAIPR